MYVRIKFEVRSFTRSWDNRGYFKTMGNPWICPRSLFSKILNGLLFGWTLWMYRPNVKSVTLPVSSGCKFPIWYMCQKLWKLAGSRQSYCKNKQAYFFGPPCMLPSFYYHDTTNFWLLFALLSQLFRTRLIIIRQFMRRRNMSIKSLQGRRGYIIKIHHSCSVQAMLHSTVIEMSYGIN